MELIETENGTLIRQVMDLIDFIYLIGCRKGGSIDKLNDLIVNTYYLDELKLEMDDFLYLGDGGQRMVLKRNDMVLQVVYGVNGRKVEVNALKPLEVLLLEFRFMIS